MAHSATKPALTQLAAPRLPRRASLQHQYHPHRHSRVSHYRRQQVMAVAPEPPSRQPPPLLLQPLQLPFGTVRPHEELFALQLPLQPPLRQMKPSQQQLLLQQQTTQTSAAAPPLLHCLKLHCREAPLVRRHLCHWPPRQPQPPPRQNERQMDYPLKCPRGQDLAASLP